MTLTGVGHFICCAHRDANGGLHGHTWEIVAWFGNGDALEIQARLKRFLDQIDHKVLMHELESGEGLAEWIGENLGCVQVDVSRPAERIFAKWHKEDNTL